MRRILAFALALMLLCSMAWATTVSNIPAEDLVEEPLQTPEDPPAEEIPAEAPAEEDPGESVTETLEEDAELKGEDILDIISDSGPYPVYLVEEPVLEDPAAAPMALSDSAYLGPITTTVYQYFRDIIPSLPWGSDYVFYRADQYNYRLVFGSDLTLSGSVFSGGEVEVINYYSYTYNDQNTIDRYSDSGFSMRDPGAFVYTSLGGGYPELYEGVSEDAFQALLILLSVALLFTFIVRCFG